MKRKMSGWRRTEKQNKNFWRDDRGSAIVVVIIAMAMIGILVSAILWSAYMNYMIKISDMKNKKSFYSAETVMEQIVAGLQHEASAAITLSYQEVMQNWNPNGTQDTVVEGEKDRSSRFTTSYLSFLIKSLKASDSSVPLPPGPIDPTIPQVYYYDREKLRAFIDIDLYELMDNKEEWEGTDESTKDDNIMEIVNNSTLVLRNIRVSFTDENGYVSIINTDICIDTPELVFYQNPSIDSLYDYALIGNSGVETAANSGKSTVYGGIYAGVEETTKAGGLSVNPGSDLYVEGARYVISKGDISIEGPAASFIVNSGISGSNNSKLVSEVYADGLNVDSGTLSLDSKTYIADDLILSGTGSKATLQREYYGYGTSAVSGSEGSEYGVDAGKSSAILINGKNATVDLSKVTKLLLAGRAYIGQKSLGGSSIQTESASKQPVLMGESIAVKGNQIAYLVPAECIGTLDGKTMIGQNPLNGDMVSLMEIYREEYGEDFQEVDFNKPVYRLGNKTLMDFGVTGDKNIRKVYTQYNSADSANKTLLYYYLVMEKGDAAEYFVQYYNFNANKETIDNYFNKYASGGIILGDYESPNTQYTILGNSIVSDIPSGSISTNGDVTLLKGIQQPVSGEEEGGEAGPTEPEDEGYQEISDNVSEMENAKAEDEVENQAKEYGETYRALTTNLTTDYSKIPLGSGQNVFNSIIYTKELREYLESNGGTVEVTVKSGTEEVKAVLTNKDYIVNDSKVRLVVAISKDEDGTNGGNVKIQRNFNGLIIAQGTITLDNGVKINDTKYDNSDIRREIFAALNAEFPDDSMKTPISFFVNGGGTLSEEVTGSAKVDENGVLNVDLSEIVRYTNWIKK